MRFCHLPMTVPFAEIKPYPGGMEENPNSEVVVSQQQSSKRIHAEVIEDVRVINDQQAGAATPPGLTLTEPSAFIALIFAILSWCLLPILGALIALGIAPGAKRRIRESNGVLGGKKLAVAAQVIAISNLLAAVLVVYAFIAFIKWIF